MPVARFGVFLENDLLDELDAYAHENKFPNRSQAIHQQIKKNLLESKSLFSTVLSPKLLH
ncbi:MAG TPA: ribbon-helix-helix domain-containing protein [Paludibacter sp.]|nr:ribbon-helix-helix domain-containing protein [Paludibacter sp.]